MLERGSFEEHGGCGQSWGVLERDGFGEHGGCVSSENSFCVSEVTWSETWGCSVSPESLGSVLGFELEG